MKRENIKSLTLIILVKNKAKKSLFQIHKNRCGSGRHNPQSGEDVTDKLFDKENAPPYKLVDLVPPEYNEKSETYFELQKRGTTTFNVDVKTK